MIKIYKRNSYKRAAEDSWPAFETACVNIGVSWNILQKVKPHVVVDRKELDEEFIETMKKLSPSDISVGIANMPRAQHADFDEFVDYVRCVYWAWTLRR